MIPQQTTMPDRRFPPPWTAEETETCFIVKGRGGRRYVEGRKFLAIFSNARHLYTSA